MFRKNFHQVPIHQLQVGCRLAHPLSDGKNLLLLAAGTEITEGIKDRLLTRGIDSVFMHQDDSAALGPSHLQSTNGHASDPDAATAVVAPPPARPRTTARLPAPHTTTWEDAAQAQARLADSRLAELAKSVPLELDLRGPALRDSAKEHGCRPYDQQQRKRLHHHFTTTRRLMSVMIRNAVAGLPQDSVTLQSAVSSLVAELVDDSDHSISAMAELAGEHEITEKSVNLSVLSMAVAMELGWDEPNIRQVGICGLVHDWGVHSLPEHFHQQQASLSPDERNQYRQHPLHSLRLLEKMKSVSDVVRLAIAQVHECPDGSGYPLGLVEKEIHPYARVLHVVDAYLNLTSQVWGREPFLPYDAMVYLLHQVKAKRMDNEAMRGLLTVVALFPLGSHVRLSDGTEARVVRHSRESYTSPIVQRVGADRKIRVDAAHEPLIDLGKSELSVVAPVSAPDRQEQHIDGSLMSQVLWD